jgi:hypothetical protein
VTPLRELQRQLAVALLGGDDAAAAAAVRDDGLPGAARLAIYRHHVFTTLTAVLAAAFPVVQRLVDPRFFGYAADRYIRVAPPAGPCLHEYGESFPAFLGDFPPSRTLPYLPDVARLEWAMHRALHAPDGAALGAAALRSVPPERASELILTLDPSVSLLASPWPVDRIWRANQLAAGDAAVDLGAGASALEVRRLGEDVVFRSLGRGAFAFRLGLQEGATLGAAAERAVAAEPGFDLRAGLVALVEEDLVVGFGGPPSNREVNPCHGQP